MTRLLGDRYELRRRLWTGALTEVHEAVDLKRDQRVVVELLRTKPAQDSQNVALFKLAFRTAAGLKHVHIEHVSPAEQVEGYHLVTRELLGGRTLRQTVEATGSLTPERALTIALDASEALAHAHRSGTAHGALTPDSIHIGPTGHVMLGGFGVSARSTDGLDAQFAAPERQSLRQANPACDIYALGRCLQFMLTGDVPSPDHADVPVPQLDQPELDAVTRRLLAREPHERHVTMGAVIDDLQRCREAAANSGTRAIRPDAVIPPPLPLKPSGRRPPAATSDDSRAGTPAGEPEGHRHWRRRLLIAAACSLLVAGGWAALSGDSADNARPAGDQAQADVMTDTDDPGDPPPGEAGMNSPGSTGLGSSTTTRPGDPTPPSSSAGGPETPATTAVAADSSGGSIPSDEVPEGDPLRPPGPSGSVGSVASTSTTSTTTTPGSTPTTRPRTSVPDVVGMTEQEAVDTLAASQLDAQVTANCLLCALGCKVTDQSPQEASVVAVGSTVDLTIGCL